MRLISLFMSLMGLVSVSHAISSSEIKPMQGLVPQSLQTYVDTNNCTAPLRSSPYVIVLGNGGADMKLSCPAERPIMYSWRQKVGFGGVASVQAGGGRSWITCCAVGHRWASTASVNPG